MTTALKMVFKGLQLAGIDLPETSEDQKRKFLDDIETLHERIHNLPNVSDLASLPDCTDPMQLNSFKLYVFLPKQNISESTTNSFSDYQ
jgi:hypothetical protein